MKREGGGGGNIISNETVSRGNVDDGKEWVFVSVAFHVFNTKSAGE
jgi:hypothetical protein